MVAAVLSTAQKGEWALLRVLQRALERGWIASRPTRDCRYDLVLDDGERLYRVQVKYCARKSTNAAGVVYLDFTKGGTRNRTYLDHEIDAVLVYVAPANVIVWLGPGLFHNRKATSIRYAPTRSGQQKGTLPVSEITW